MLVYGDPCLHRDSTTRNFCELLFLHFFLPLSTVFSHEESLPLVFRFRILPPFDLRHVGIMDCERVRIIQQHGTILLFPSSSPIRNKMKKKKTKKKKQESKPSTTTKKRMQNESGEIVDLYVPRKCSYTNRLIKAKDHASVQINVANVDPVTGIMTNENTTFCLAGYIRFKAEGDMALSYLVQKNDATTLAAR